MLVDQGRSWVVLAILVCLPPALWLAANNLFLELWYDEVYTLKRFVFVPLRRTLTYYPVPNNHILHNILNQAWRALLAMDRLEDALSAG